MYLSLYLSDDDRFVNIRQRDYFADAQLWFSWESWRVVILFDETLEKGSEAWGIINEGGRENEWLGDLRENLHSDFVVVLKEGVAQLLYQLSGFCVLRVIDKDCTF